MNKRWIVYALLIVVILLVGAGLDKDKKLSFVYIKGPAWQSNYTKPTDNLININTATQEELTELDGIGETIAERIIERRKISPFTSIGELKEIKGIGNSKFNAIKYKIKV